jgi:hypothetical protein
MVSIGWLDEPSALRIPWPSGDLKGGYGHLSTAQFYLNDIAPNLVAAFIKRRRGYRMRSAETAQSWQGTLISIDQLAAGVVGHRRCSQMGRDAGFRRGRKARQFHSQAPARECLERL